MNEQQEEKIIEEQQEDKQKRKEKMWRIIAIILSVFLIIVLLFWVAGSEEFRIFPFLGFLIIIILVFVGLFFGIGWYRKYQELQEKSRGEGKLPPPVTLEQAKTLIEEQLRSPEYADYTTGWIQHKVYNVGKTIKSRVLVVQLKTTYNLAPYQFYIMNLHDPKNLYCFIEQYKYNQGEITRAVNNLSYYPEDEPDEREIVVDNPITGSRVITREKMQHKIEKEEKKGDFE